MNDAKHVTNLVEEMADVLICIQLLQRMYHIADHDLMAWVARKTSRQAHRMGLDTKEKTA